MLFHLGREHLGLEYLSAVLKGRGHEVELALDPGIFGLNDNVFYSPFLEKRFDHTKKIMKQLRRFQPDIAAFSAYTTTIKWALAMAERVKQSAPETVTVVGGVHVTLAGRRVLENEAVDYVIAGEAEEAFGEFADCAGDVEAVRGLANIGWREGENIIFNPLRPAIKDLDSLPFPDKELFSAHIRIRDDYIMMTSRGCVNKCTYCSENVINRLYSPGFYRKRSVDSCIDELVFMKRKYDFREVMFNDAIFMMDKRWLNDFLDRYRERIDVPFRCFGHASHIDRETAEMLGRAGCARVEFGMQTVDEDLKTKVLRRKESNEQARAAFEVCDAAGLQYDIDHIFGLPFEKEESHAEAAGFYSGCGRLNRVKCHLLTYFPGTEILETARQEGLVSEDEYEKVYNGDGGDFFHKLSTVEDRNKLERITACRRLMKIQPLFHKRTVDFFS